MWCKFIEAAHLCCKIYGKASTKASEVQDGNNNERLLFSAVQHSSGMQNGCSSLNNTTNKGALKHLAAEVNELLLIRQRAFLSCVTMINVLYESLAVPVKLWNLKVQIITVNFSEAVWKWSFIDIPGGEQDHMTHCTHYTNHWFPLVCDDESPKIRAARSWAQPLISWKQKADLKYSSPFPLIQNGTSLIGQSMKTAFNLLKPVIPQVPLKGHFGTQSKTKRHPRKDEMTR